MATPNALPVIINEHPESKISFLEQSLIGKDWRAIVLFGEEGGLQSSQLPALRDRLLGRGYLVTEGLGSAGKPILSIHHLGAGTEIADVSREAGGGRGLAYAITHPWVPFKTPASYVKNGFLWLAHGLQDPARANGIINTTAEGFLLSAGKGAQYGKFTDPKNALLSLAGLSWLGQSLAYLVFGKNNEQRAYERIANKIDATVKNGGDITKITFDPSKDRDPSGPLASARAFMHRFTVPIGAVLNNLGMVSYLGHAWLERKHHIAQRALNPMDEQALRYIGKEGVTGFRNWIKTGYGKDTFGAILSLIGWSILMIPPKTPRTESEIAQEQTTPFGRFWDKFRENTPMLAGLFTLGASSFRLMGAQSKGNVLQQTGEKIYIGGDIALMFTNSHEYGGDKKLDPERLSEKILENIGKQPILMGTEQQREFIDHAVQYWLDKNKADTEASTINRRVPRKIVEESAIEIRQVLTRRLAHMQSERFEHLCENAAEIVARFPKEHHPALTEGLSRNLAHQPWMRMTEKEMLEGITSALAHLPSIKERPLTMQLIARDAISISSVIPGIDQAASAAAVYDAVAPFTQQMTDKQLSVHPKTRITGGVTHVTKGLEAANDPQLVIAASAR